MNFYGSSSRDAIYGTQFNDVILAYSGNDYVNAGGGHDFIDGGYGNDHINGGSGNDTLRGGRGGDVLTGGSGIDTFQFALGDTTINPNGAFIMADRHDTITDFSFSDRLDVPDSVDAGGHLVLNGGLYNGRIEDLDSAAYLAMLHDAADPRDLTAVLLTNTDNGTDSYLVMDMDGNGTFESGIVIEGGALGLLNLPDAFLDSILV